MIVMIVTSCTKSCFEPFSDTDPVNSEWSNFPKLGALKQMRISLQSSAATLHLNHRIRSSCSHLGNSLFSSNKCCRRSNSRTLSTVAASDPPQILYRLGEGRTASITDIGPTLSTSKSSCITNIVALHGVPGLSITQNCSS